MPFFGKGPSTEAGRVFGVVVRNETVELQSHCRFSVFGKYGPGLESFVFQMLPRSTIAASKIISKFWLP